MEHISELRSLVQNADLDRLRSALRTAQLGAASLTDFIEQTLVPFEHAVGSLCEGNVLSAELAAVASEIVADLIDEFVPDVDGTGRPHVAIACPYGEWHDLPARMVWAVLQERNGWRISRLGPSVSDDALDAFVRRDDPPVAVALSCTLSMHLGSAASAVRVVQRAGIPVVVGGAAFGSTEQRAKAIGADQWCRDAANLGRTLQQWERDPPEVRTTSATAAAFSELGRARIIDTALRSLGRDQVTAHIPALRSERTPRRLYALLGLAESAHVTDDPTVLAEGLDWWKRAMHARETDPVAYLEAAFDALAAATDPGALRSLLLYGRSLAREH